jgi:hypothetical protein
MGIARPLSLSIVLVSKCPFSLLSRSQSIRLLAGAGVGRRRDRHGGADEAGGRVLLLLCGQSGTTAFLEREKLAGTELLVVEVVGGFDEVLEVGPGKELAEVDKVRVLLVLDWKKVKENSVVASKNERR